MTLGITMTRDIITATSWYHCHMVGCQLDSDKFYFKKIKKKS